jgi:hypothetical protein
MTPGAAWPSTCSPAPQIVAQWSPRLVGTLVRLAVHRVVEADRRVVDGRAVTEIMKAVLPPGLSVTHRLMLTQRGVARLLVWGEHFDPRPGWTPLEGEQLACGASVDLLWTRAGRVRADSLTMGPLSRADRSRARRAADVCAAAFGAEFVGVRLISLAPVAPARELITAENFMP